MRRVVVTGIGAVTPVGNTAPAMWEALLAGRSGVGPLTTFDASAYACRIAGEVRGFDAARHFPPKEARRLEKFVQYAVVAAKEAAQDAHLELGKENPDRMGALVGSGIGSLRIIEEQHQVVLDKGPSKITPFLIPMLIVNMAPAQIAITLGLKGPNSCTATACASGAHAVGDAFRLIQRGEADIMFTGGTESCITPLGIGGFCALLALSRRNDAPAQASRPFDKGRDGFVLGEGAGIAVLEELEHAHKRGAAIYAEVAGYGMTGDAYHMTAPAPDGDGAARAMHHAMADARLRPEEIAYINAHGTSTELNDKVETAAIKRVFREAAARVAVSSTKSMTGHLLGAAGGVEFLISALAIKHQVAPPTINYEEPDPECDLDYVPNQARRMPIGAVLSNSLGFGGHNATLILKRFTG